MRDPDTSTPGNSDCERLRTGWVAQPANTVSSLAYVAAGLVLMRWARVRPSIDESSAWPVATGLITAGLGSLDYHGFQSPLAQWGHDWGIAVPLVAAVHADAGELLPQVPPRLRSALSAGALAAMGLLLARRPRSGPLGAAVGVLALGTFELALWGRGRRPGPRRRSGPLLAAAAGCGLAGAAVLTLSRSGGPWCRPDSLLQGHAAWHVLSAMSLASWALAVLPEGDRPGASG